MIRSLRLLAAVVVVGLLAPVGQARAEDVDGVVKAVEAKYAGVTSMKADFVQTRHSVLFPDEQESGQLTVKRPSKMRWDFKVAGAAPSGAPTKQFITDGATMWVYNAADNQVIKYEDLGAAGATADALLQSLDSLDEHFDVELQAPPAGGGHTLELKPRQDAGIKSVQLVLGPDLLVRTVKYVDPFDTVTELSFSKMQLNTDVPDSHFAFSVPKGASVIVAGAGGLAP